MRTIVFILAMLTVVGVVSAERIYTVHAKQFPSGAAESNILLIGHLYAISLDPETKVATWCCYRATSADSASRNSLNRNWLQALPDATLEESDFRGPEYDIGHMTPLGTFKASPYAFELNFLANCAPQTPSLNRGPWVRLEDRIRELAKVHDAVDVAIGTLYETPMPPLPAADEPHVVPSAFWAVVTPHGERPQCYIVDQSCERGDSIDGFAVSIEEVTRRSGLTFTSE